MAQVQDPGEKAGNVSGVAQTSGSNRGGLSFLGQVPLVECVGDSRTYDRTLFWSHSVADAAESKYAAPTTESDHRRFEILRRAFDFFRPLTTDLVFFFFFF